MKQYEVLYDPVAQDDISEIYFWLADAAGLPFANRFRTRLQTYCNGLEFTPFRASVRDPLRPDLRIVTFEGCVSIAYGVEDSAVRILRLLYRGRSLDQVLESET